MKKPKFVEKTTQRITEVGKYVHREVSRFMRAHRRKVIEKQIEKLLLKAQALKEKMLKGK